MRPIFALALLGAVPVTGGAIAQTPYTVVASGLEGPRGLTFGPDGNLNTFPIVPGSSQVLDISRHGAILNTTRGFTTVTGLRYHHDRLYALELSAAAGNPAPGTGKVVRVDEETGDVTDVVTGLGLPTAMTFGPNGDLYVSNLGAASGTAGEIVRISSNLIE